MSEASLVVGCVIRDGKTRLLPRLCVRYPIPFERDLRHARDFDRALATAVHAVLEWPDMTQTRVTFDFLLVP